MLPLVVTRPAPKIPAGISVSSHGVKGYLKGLWTYVSHPWCHINDYAGCAQLLDSNFSLLRVF